MICGIELAERFVGT